MPVVLHIARRLLGSFRYAVWLLFAVICLKAQVRQPSASVTLPSELRNRAADSASIVSMLQRARKMVEDNPDSAFLLIQAAIEKCKPHQFHTGIFQAYLMLGVAYAENGGYTGADSVYRLALALSQKTEDPDFNASRVYNNKGNLMRYQGDYKKAAEYYFAALNIMEKRSGTKTDSATVQFLASVYNNMSGPLLQLNQQQKALHYMDKAVLLARQQGMTSLIITTTNNKASIYAQTGNMEQAIVHHRQALDLAVQQNDRRSQLVSLRGLGDVYIDNGAPEKAIPYLLKALKMNEPNPFFQLGITYSLGCAYLDMKQYAAAEKYLLQTLNDATEANVKEYEFYTHEQLSNLYATLANYKKAYLHEHAAYKLNDSLLNKEKTRAVNALEIQYRTAEKNKKILADQLMISQQHQKINNTRTWALFLTSVIVIMLGSLFSLYRSARIRRKLQEVRINQLEQEKEINALKAMVTGEERERARIARELHDGIGGTLAAVKMNFMTAQKRISQLPDIDPFNESMRMLDDLSQEIRQTAHNLMPECILENGLPEAIRLYCIQVSKSNQCAFEFQAYGSFDNLEDNFVLTAYRIVQELIHNIIKHAAATHAIILVSCHGNLLTISVEDDGKGFDPAAVHAGLGLKNVQSRVNNMKGTLSIDSSLFNGTAVYLEFEVKKIQIPIPV